MIGTIVVFCKNILCWKIIFFIVPCFDNDYILYGTKLKFESPSFKKLHKRFFSNLVLLGEIRISQTKVVTLSFPLLSSITLLYKSKAGIVIFWLSVGFLVLSLIWRIRGTLSLWFRSSNIRLSWLAILKLSRSVTYGLLCVNNLIECSVYALNLL